MKDRQVSLADIKERARAILERAGLVVDDIDLSGRTVPCGTTKKPNGTDGRYKVHADFPPTVGFANYHNGGAWQNVPLWQKSELAAMTQAEKDALRERIQKERKEAKARKENAQKSAAAYASRTFAGLPPAGAGNAYLKRKGVPPLGEARQTPDGRLALPVKSADGRLVSLQFIGADGNKRFLKGGEKKGCFFSIPAKGGDDSGPLLIAEGYATAASVRLATGHAALVAFDSGNLLPVAKAARGLFPRREIILCADNDVDGKGPDGSPWNPGREKAEEAARAVGGKVALCPAINGRSADFNDLFTNTEDGPERVRVILEKARKAGEGCPVPVGFKLIPEGPRAGLYSLDEKKDGDIQEIWLGPPLRVLGFTRDEDGQDWGIFMEFTDPDGKTHTHALPRSALSLEGWDWHADLASKGWLGEPAHKRKLAAFFSRLRPVSFFRCVPRVGWHGNAFVLPDMTIGDTGAEKVILQAGRPSLGYRCAGTLDAWRNMAALCVGNSRLVLSLCTAFAGPLLNMAGLESGGFNLVGGSSTGKSTAQKLAASVWDGPEFVRSWRTSDNGLEGLAAMHNDTALIMDEMGQAAPKNIAEAAYMLGNGQGKARADRNGHARKVQRWRLVVLSSGEVGLAEKLAEIGIRPRPGQEVRLVDIQADAGAGMGVVENLHGFSDSGALVRHLQDEARTNYGHAGRKFLEYVTEHASELEKDAPEAVRLFVSQVCPEDANGQVRRVALRFGLCAFAGIVAVKSGVLPWEESAAVEGVKACFRQWLKDRGTAGASEDAAILQAVRLFIEKNGSSRFQDMEAGDRAQCINRVGFRRTLEGKTEYIILPGSLQEVAGGASARRAAVVLKAAGWLETEAGRSATKRDLPGFGRARCYVVRLPADEEPEEAGVSQ